jgi:hypothetical protein
MLKDRQLERIAFKEKLFSVTKYSIGLGLIVLLFLAVYEPMGKYWDKDNGDYKKHNKHYKMEVVK